MNTTTATAPEPPEEKLVNVDELLEILWTKQSRPSSRWLRDRTDTGEIPHVKLGGRIFYSVEAVKDALLRKPKFIAFNPSSKEEERAAWKHYKAEMDRLKTARDMSEQD